MTQMSRADLLAAILRKDLSTFIAKVFETLEPGKTFVPGWHIGAIAHQLERVLRGEVKRLIINMPPRSLKSIAASVALPAFILGQDATKRVICASYSNDLSRKLSNDFRAVVRASWYLDLFPATRIGGKDSEGEIEFTARGSRLATAVEGTLTGRGGDIIVIDDPLKGWDAMSAVRRDGVNQWYANTLISRLDDKRASAIIIVMQRLHMDDLTGFVLDRSEDWTVLSLPAIAEVDEKISLPYGKVHHRRMGDVLAPEREDRHTLESLKLQLGPDLFSAQYQQSPVPPGGLMVKREWIKRYSDLDEVIAKQPMVVQSWDTAQKGGPENDWSVCTTWYRLGTLYYLAEVWRGRVNYPTLKEKVVELARTWRAHAVLIEEVGTAVALVDELNSQVSGLRGIKPKFNKDIRMSTASAKMHAGQVFFPEKAPWLPDLEAELFAFPGGRNDDQVDSISQALNEMDEMIDNEALSRNLPVFMNHLFGPRY